MAAGSCCQAREPGQVVLRHWPEGYHLAIHGREPTWLDSNDAGNSSGRTATSRDRRQLISAAGGA